MAFENWSVEWRGAGSKAVRKHVGHVPVGWLQQTLQRRGSAGRRLGVGVLGINGVLGGSQAAEREPGRSAWWEFSHKEVVCDGQSPSSVP